MTPRTHCRQLMIDYTFEVNETVAAIQSGKYSNVRELIYTHHIHELIYILHWSTLVLNIYATANIYIYSQC